MTRGGKSGPRRLRGGPAIIVLLASIALAYVVFSQISGRENGTADPNDARQVALGRQVYGDLCASCHGDRLQGQPNWRRPLPAGGYPAPPHDKNGHTWHHPDQRLFDVTKYGGAKSAPPGFKSNMPGFANQTSDKEIWAVLAFIKSRWPLDIRRRQEAMNRRATR